jgi:hypothetical protein
LRYVTKVNNLGTAKQARPDKGKCEEASTENEGAEFLQWRFRPEGFLRPRSQSGQKLTGGPADLSVSVVKFLRAEANHADEALGDFSLVSTILYILGLLVDKAAQLGGAEGDTPDR